MILNCLKTKEPYVGPKSDCQISPIYLQFWWVLSYIFRLLSPIFLYFWTPKVLDTLHLTSTVGTMCECSMGIVRGPDHSAYPGAENWYNRRSVAWTIRQDEHSCSKFMTY